MQSDIEINDSNFLCKMIPTLCWFIYWFIFYIGASYGISGYYALCNILFFASAILIIVSIFMRNGFLYKIGFFIYIGHFVVSIIITIGILSLVLFFIEKYIQMVGFTFSIAGSAAGDTEGLDLANDAVKTALLIFKVIICIAFAIEIITEICFLCHLRSRIKYFESYASFAMNKSPDTLQPLQQV